MLDLFESCVAATSGIRKEYSLAHPELQISRWDAGWRQPKDLFKEHRGKGFADLRDAYRKIERKLAPMLCELGFLREQP